MFVIQLGMVQMRNFSYGAAMVSISALIWSTVAAQAISVKVPEIDAFAGLSAMALVGSIGALIWERRRKSKR